MKIRVVPPCTFALISLLSIFGFGIQSNAQDIWDQSSHRMRGKAGRAHRANAEAAPSSTFQVLYSFCAAAQCTDGSAPVGGLIQDSAGNLYGTTSNGGANTAANHGNGGGTVFKVDSEGHETVLYSFCSAANCADGQNPYAGLIQDTAGNLYGTTVLGGAKSLGTVFKLDNTGHETVLYSFCEASGCTDGYSPYAPLIQDKMGSLYGTTVGGGANDFGTVFKVDQTGHFSVLYSFCPVADPCSDGAGPLAGLIEDAAGNLYGTTQAGGLNNCTFAGIGGGCGTVFMLDDTAHETVLYGFGAFTGDGVGPDAGVMRDASGNLYGTTELGGNTNSMCVPYGACGTVFKLDKTGHETLLYSFCPAANCLDGAVPRAGLVQDSEGNLYGTTYTGGANIHYGSVFEVDNTGHETVLYSFCPTTNCPDGAAPTAGLILDTAGNLYGTTIALGANGMGGTVFKLATGSGGGGTAVVTLTSNPNPSFINESVTFTATVSGTGATPTGSVTFKEGSTALGTVTLANGQASLSTTFTTKGTASIVANYSGDANYKAATSRPLKQVVKQYTTTTALTSSLNPSTYGQAVTLTGTVTSPGPTPTGTVTFKNGTKSLGSASLSGGVAKLTTSTLAVGTVTITASYGGDAANAKSTSPALKQVVNKATSTTAIVSSMNPSKVGKKVKFTATVTSPTTTPTGTVTFMDGSTTLGTANLAKGKASYSTSALSAGSHNISSVYAGTADISGSTSPVLVQTVN